jgi:hypothetical protein
MQEEGRIQRDREEGRIGDGGEGRTMENEEKEMEMKKEV